MLVDDDLIRAVQGNVSKKGVAKATTYYPIKLDS